MLYINDIKEKQQNKEKKDWYTVLYQRRAHHPRPSHRKS